MRVLVTAETFTLSSNIVMDTSTFLLRYAGCPWAWSIPLPAGLQLTSWCLSTQDPMFSY